MEEELVTGPKLKRLNMVERASKVSEAQLAAVFAVG